MEGTQQHRRLATIARHLTDSSSLHALAYEHNIKPGDKTPVVIGGMVLDIQSSPKGKQLLRGSTSPGEVRYENGGVARNIAENMALLGSLPFLISVVGDDVAGESMLKHWKSLGLSTAGIRTCKGARTPVVSAVFDNQGELAAAVADTNLIEEKLTVEWIMKFKDDIQRATIIILDANLPPPALEATCKLAKETNVPIWFEPVSVAKSVRASRFLNLITYTSPNEAELIAMAESVCQVNNIEKKLFDDEVPADKNLPEPAASLWRTRHYIQSLLDTGLGYIILTLGEYGAVLCSLRSTSSENLGTVKETPLSGISKNESGINFLHFPALRASISNLSGAGDCLAAGTVSALSSGADISSALANGVSASKWAVESASNVPPNLDPASVADCAKMVKSRAQKLVV
ncbi:pseudouridine kinase [Physcomitrium patens]|uniref:Carbohydrate kinase PfkB domain-containing protein n=1 Tax=Physcomitrium patens TaxID=3218 RepID=A9SQL6_PHYPA|nr:uncharacterized protein LOC112292084 [Physcomitrium patens]XP_024395997.1 uncharacterized protein LOC112292084 [Physcomitrium patens]XP_024395998.1 uncharacterized protein LOC112292084 [Physcomitrium patens]XP_024395999.1 uncharacterized protein LOC112292084 [Physcomitrium patens]XP_024396000.1 uncharacterized protein LOC112292084 [Physcomitrium patens]PNR39449.1 hypothetical protein PHYPA_019727 [Physcomitrium patens]|eukprot:XP_024395996.1 uncharacterized protein LOC112292084 [Physcomitrella patens]